MLISPATTAFAYSTALPPAAPATHPSGATTLLLVLIVVGVIVYDRHRRQQALKALAESRRLDYLGKSMPTDFPTDMLGKLGSWYHFGRWRRSNNVISGIEGNDRLLAFDAVVGRGRYQFTQTWVARRVSSPFNPPTTDGDLLFRQYGQWRAVARKRQLLRGTRMNTATIQEMWQRLR